MAEAAGCSNNALRALTTGDLERVITIDRFHSGRARRRFFEKRFTAAAAHPEEFIQIGITRGGSLRGFIMARLLRGEFGREDVSAVLDAVGVEMESQELGIGRALVDGLVEALRRTGARCLQSQAVWTNYDLLRFFDAAGFELAPRLVLERLVAEPLAEASEDV